MRRVLLAGLASFLLASFPFALPSLAASPPGCPLPADPANDELWAELMAGNAVFVGGDVHYAGLRQLRRAMATWQAPPVSALSCADSRVMPEVTFDRTIGELFVSRVAGNIADDYGVASLDYAVANAWTSLIVVIGHSDCGAVKAALRPDDDPPPGTPALGVLLAKIREGLDAAHVPRTTNPSAADLRHAVEVNARFAARQLTADSPLLRSCVDAGRLQIVTAYYDVGTGVVARLP